MTTQTASALPSAATLLSDFIDIIGVVETAAASIKSAVETQNLSRLREIGVDLSEAAQFAAVVLRASVSTGVSAINVSQELQSISESYVDSHPPVAVSSALGCSMVTNRAEFRAAFCGVIRWIKKNSDCSAIKIETKSGRVTIVAEHCPPLTAATLSAMRGNETAKPLRVDGLSDWARMQKWATKNGVTIAAGNKSTGTGVVWLFDGFS